jgi:SNF2 family DNA or RNA helicase
MGLGKSIQAVASMSMYRNEWPLMVITPSGARYHWEHEFRHWLRDILHDHDVYVMTSGNDLIPAKAKVVIYSYGLIKAIPPGYFACAICDESHMLKNCHSKRTLMLAPILKATTRCLLLSGTPALARPLELWPQLDILNISSFGWNIDYSSFERKFSKKDGGSAHHRAELHTMLTGTVMIRRMKNDILKTMPKKIRSLAQVCCVKSPRQRATFVRLMDQLRQSKGVMGTLANAHRVANRKKQTNNNNGGGGGVSSHDEFGHDDTTHHDENNNNNHAGVVAVNGGGGDVPLSSRVSWEEQRAQHLALQQMKERQFEQGCVEIRERIRHQAAYLHPDEFIRMERHLHDALRQKIGYYPSSFPPPQQQQQPFADFHHDDPVDEEEEVDEEVSKKQTLSKLYSLTAEVKIPLVVDMLKRWLADDTKSKICIFAHHLSFLDALQNQCDMGHPGKKFIRIDGSTSPRLRQDQITAFQTDPSVRVALLGITAAGVAVTLTAASTVWFAELFWTPAIMIQAEDRCHRIGQYVHYCFGSP